MTELTIDWQRLVDDGETCPRCGDTGSEVRAAAAALTAALAPLGIQVRLAEASLGPAEFERAPLESNRILIRGRTVEDWLGGATGQSPCCDVCGPNECRTVTVDGTTYETVPADLIVRAGLLAAAELLAGPASEPCCGSATEPADAVQPCCAPVAAPPAGGRRSLPLAAGGCC